MTKHLLALVGVLFGTTLAFAGAQNPFSKLVSEVESQSVFKQITTQPHCPKFITMVAGDAKNSIPGAQPGDLLVRFSAHLPNVQDNGNFTFSGGSIHYRPGLIDGWVHVLSRNLDFPLGIAYGVSTQFVQNGVLVTEYSAKVASAVMIASTNFKVSYDANVDQIHYHFAGNGVEDVDCTFKKIQK